MNEPFQFLFTEHLQLVLLGAAPLVAILLFLLLSLLLLRLHARKKSGRMSRAEREMTGIGATTWDAYHGPATVGAPTVDPAADPRER